MVSTKMKTHVRLAGLLGIVLAGSFLSHFLHKPALAATFDLLASQKYGTWESNRYRNQSSGRTFCAAEVKDSSGTLLRLNIYNDNKEAFFELYNKKWTMRGGGVRFSLSFDDGISAELQGKSWGDSYTYDFLEQQKMAAIFGLLMKNSSVRVLNSNGARIAAFSLKGAQGAISSMMGCSNGQQKYSAQWD